MFLDRKSGDFVAIDLLGFNAIFNLLESPDLNIEESTLERKSALKVLRTIVLLARCCCVIFVYLFAYFLSLVYFLSRSIFGLGHYGLVFH